jgi:hypothetical protein
MDSSIQPTEADPFVSIELTDARESIKELYYTQGRGSIFSYKKTKRPLIAMVSFAVLSGFGYFLSFSNQIGWVVLLVLSVFFLAGSLFIFSVKARQYFQWKSKITVYTDWLSNYGTVSLRLRAHTFELIFDDDSTIENWRNLKKASILSTHIQLNCDSGSQYLFPARCMGPENYELLKQFIWDKMNNPEAIKEISS